VIQYFVYLKASTTVQQKKNHIDGVLSLFTCKKNMQENPTTTTKEEEKMRIKWMK
jgi:hypothetical protein